jgi:ABC-type transport system involved in cytochrome c biogenesis ATPase subunit
VALWFFRDATGRATGAWLRTLSPGHVSLVPRGAPLLDRRSALSNTRLLTALSNRACTPAEATTALRTMELPDRLLDAKASRLSQSQRLMTWLAICRLRGSPITVLMEPFTGIPGVELEPLIRLIREAATRDRNLLLVSIDPTTGDACQALPVRDLMSPQW